MPGKVAVQHFLAVPHIRAAPFAPSLCLNHPSIRLVLPRVTGICWSLSQLSSSERQGYTMSELHNGKKQKDHTTAEKKLHLVFGLVVID